MGITKKGIFFSTDALIALTITLLLVITLVPLLKVQQKESKIPADLLQTFSTLKIASLNNSYVQSLVSSGVINDTNKTVLEQIGAFYVQNLTRASEFTTQLLSQLPIEDNIGIWYGPRLIASLNTTPYETAKNIEVRRQIITGIQEGESVTGFSARAFLSSASQAKYFYFGGYSGDGNITVPIQYSGNITSAILEIAVNRNFTLLINNISIGVYNSSPSDFAPQIYTLPINYFTSGNNTLQLQGESLRITGGFVKITYTSGVQYQQSTVQHLPGVVGIINLYDGITIPGQLQSISAYLHYKSNYTTYLTIGNTTVFNSTLGGEQYQTLNNTYLSTLLNYNSLSNKTVPVRFGIQEIILNGSGGNADVILITDVSGSMDWRFDNDNTGTARNCTDPQINASSTKRISLAKCLDISFVQTILSGSGNRVGLVSFSSSANNYLNLTTNKTLLNNTILGYTASGGTCVSCAINRAYALLQANSNNTRQQYILVMTDGVTNTRSTAVCTNLEGIGANSTATLFAAGEAGILLQRNASSEYNTLTSPANTQINDIDMLNATLAVAVGDNGLIVQWTPSGWSSVSSPLSTTLQGVDFFNKTLALAVGDSGKVVRWNGTGWGVLATISNDPTLKGISIYNSTFIYAVGERSNRGRVYRSVNAGASWSEVHNAGSNTDLESIKIINATLAVAVGDNGLIVQWTPSGWSSVSSPTSHDLTAVDALNATAIYAAGGDDGNVRVIQKIGSAGWSTAYSDGSADTVQDIIVINATAIYAAGDGATIVEYDGASWRRSFNIPAAYQGNSSSGISCASDEDSCSETDSFPARNTRYSACRVHDELNATIHAVGFGPVVTCAFATTVLQNISSCGNGSYYASSNASMLQEIYATIANDILALSYSEQTATFSGGQISSQVYPDSFIAYQYLKTSIPAGVLLTLEKKFDNDTSATFSIPQNSSVVEAYALSYSGARWTSLVTLNNNTIYNLSSWEGDFLSRGDPYAIHIPLKIINATNHISILTGISPTNVSVGSSYNKVVYTTLRNISAYASIKPAAAGCIWTIQFEDNTTAVINAPQTYTDAQTCSYTSLASPFAQLNSDQDAFQVAAATLFELLDADSNGKIDVKINEQDLLISESAIVGIPYTWATEVQIWSWN